MKERLEKSLLKKVERLEAFEERLAIKIENLSIRISDGDDWISLFCEIHPIKGTTIDERLTVECVLYDQEGSILEVKENHIYPDDFFGFEVMEFSFFEDKITNKVGKVRIYPKKR